MDDRLIARAKMILRSGPASETDLARALFGAHDNPGPWTAILRKALGRSAGLRRGPDGVWRLEVAPRRVPLAVAGRGTRARGGRLVALAAAEVGGSGSMWRWSFAHRNRMPDYVRASAGLRDIDMETSGNFAAVAEEIATLLSGRKLLILDDYLPERLAREFDLLGLSPPFLEMVPLTAPVVAAGRKASMETLRKSLGLQPYSDDELAAELEVIRRLWMLGENGGQPTCPPDVVRRVGRLRTVAAEAPSVPGVYTFLDSERQPLYIGSASNLRRRVLSYFGQQIELTREMRGLLDRTQAIDLVPLGTHVEAVALEADWIERRSPPYNVQLAQKSSEAWIRIGTEYPLNVVQVVGGPKEDGAAYLGPYGSGKLAAEIAEAVATLWGLPRRGARKRADERSAERRDELVGLLRDIERLPARLRRRFSRVSDSLSQRERAKLPVLIASIERTLASRGAVGSSERAALLCIRHEAGSDLVYLCLVTSKRCVAGSRFELREPDLALRALEGLVAATGSDPGESSGVVSRWLYMHRDDPWVLPFPADARQLYGDILALVSARS